MENKERDTADAERITALEEWGNRLSRALHQERRKSANLREEAARWRDIAEDERTSWQRIHDAMNLLRQDAMAVMEAKGATPLYRELEKVRAENLSLHRTKSRRRAVTRKAVENLAEARQESRDKDAVIVQMNERLNTLEKQRDEAVTQAEDIIRQRDEQVRRFRGWCERWYKGDVGAIEVIAGITAELGGNPMQEVSEIDRRLAVQHAEALSLMSEATSQLGEIVTATADVDIEYNGTPVKLVKDLVSQYEQRGRDINAWKTYEAAARGALIRLAQYAELDEEYITRLTGGDYDSVLSELGDSRD